MVVAAAAAALKVAASRPVAVAAVLPLGVVDVVVVADHPAKLLEDVEVLLLLEVPSQVVAVVVAAAAAVLAEALLVDPKVDQAKELILTPWSP